MKLFPPDIVKIAPRKHYKSTCNRRRREYEFDSLVSVNFPQNEWIEAKHYRRNKNDNRMIDTNIGARCGWTVDPKLTIGQLGLLDINRFDFETPYRFDISDIKGDLYVC